MSVVGANAAQADHWSGSEGEHWAIEHERYESMLSPFGARVLEAIAIQPGDAVVDVGCGAGDLTIAAARAVGPAGRVVGVDLSVPLLERARQRGADASLANVELFHADAQTHPFEDEFEVLISRFGVMFFDDADAALANLAHGMRAGGRLAFACWQDAGPNEWMLVPSMAALAHVPPPDPAAFEMLSPFEFADPERVRQILQGAGLTDIAIESIEQPLLFGGKGTLAEAVEFFRHGSFGTTLLTNAAADQVDRALAAVADAFAAHLTPDGVQLGAAAWLVTASKPFACSLR